MKKLLTLLTLQFCLFAGFSQKGSYGLLVGANGYDIEMSGSLLAGSGLSSVNVGAFGGYQFSESFGAKAYMIYNTTKETDYGELNSGTFSPYFDEARLKMIQFHALLQYDVNRSFGKGFYLKGGFRVNNVLEAKSNSYGGDLTEGFYKKTNTGVLLGFGTTFLKHYSFEILADYSISKTIQHTDSKPSNLGAYANLLIDVSSFFKIGKE